MKYGDTLRQRSIAEWAHYNIDYDFLKDLIKHQTTSETAKALSIPGQGETIERAFGDSFFHVLLDQHNRVNNFVKSKSGEIESRLEYIGKRLAQLQSKHPNIIAGAQLPARLVEQYAKIDADVTKAGEEIRSLSRFSTVQRTGFKKILKKYKRWTRDPELGQRFHSEISGSHDSFFRMDLGYLLDQYIDVLGAVRAPLGLAGTSTTYIDSKPPSSSSSKLFAYISNGSNLDFDMAVSTVPLGQHGNSATYWVHADHVVEVQVLLLQHMRLYTSVDARVGTPRESPHATPARRKSSTTFDKHFSNEDDAGLLVLDNIQSFVRKQNANTVVSDERVASRANASCHIRWNGSEDAAVALQTTEGSESLTLTKLKRKFVDAFLNTSNPFEDSWSQSSSQYQNGNEAHESVATARSWLVKHTEVQPIAGVGSRRSRFAGLHNSPSGGIWATLDTQIFMKEDLQKHLKCNDWISEARTGSSEFAHAVLEIRREGNHSAALLQHLDRSHLVQRVHGYSLEAHAVWACCKSSITTPPLWASLLDQDIRGLPAPARRRRRKEGSVTESQSFTSPPATSTSATSFTDGQTSPFASRNGETPATSASELVEPPSLQAFKKKRRRPYAEYPPPIQAETLPQGQTQGYWNEYDNPESEDDAYYIYIDPNAPAGFPGQEFLEACIRQTKRLFGHTSTGEQSPLLPSPDYGTSDDETADEAPATNSRSYGTLDEGYFNSMLRAIRIPRQNRRRSALERQSLIAEINIRQHQREMAKLQTYISCLAAGTVLDVILGIMVATSRRKLRGEVDVAVILGVISNLILLLVAVVSLKTRHDRLGWIHQGLVYILVIGLVVADILLFKWALSL